MRSFRLASLIIFQPNGSIIWFRLNRAQRPAVAETKQTGAKGFDKSAKNSTFGRQFDSGRIH